MPFGPGGSELRPRAPRPAPLRGRLPAHASPPGPGPRPGSRPAHSPVSHDHTLDGLHLGRSLGRGGGRALTREAADWGRGGRAGARLRAAGRGVPGPLSTPPRPPPTGSRSPAAATTQSWGENCGETGNGRSTHIRSPLPRAGAPLPGSGAGPLLPARLPGFLPPSGMLGNARECSAWGGGARGRAGRHLCATWRKAYDQPSVIGR